MLNIHMNLPQRSTTVSPRTVRSAWAKFLCDFAISGQLWAVTLVFNNRIPGTALPCVSLKDGGAPRVAPRGPLRLSGYRSIDPSIIAQSVNLLWFKVNRGMWGKRCGASQEPLTAYRGFVEHADSNVHAHLAWAVPEGGGRRTFAECIGAAWPTIASGGDCEVAEVFDPEGWGEYVVKAQLTRCAGQRGGIIVPDDDADSFLSSPAQT